MSPMRDSAFVFICILLIFCRNICLRLETKATVVFQERQGRTAKRHKNPPIIKIEADSLDETSIIENWW